MALFFALAALGHARPAPAYDFQVTARTEGYGYQLRRLDASGVTFLNRRRITQYLGLRIYNLLDLDQPRTSGGPPPARIYLHALMRFDTDFGGYQHPGQPVDELENNELDLLLGAVEGRDLWGGLLDFSLGRQYDMELWDVFAYDGLRVRLNLPQHLFLQVHFGIQVARAQPFSSARFETDGPLGEPSTDALSPTFGVAGGFEDPEGTFLRVAYRGTASLARPSQVDVRNQDLPEVWGVDQELVFFAVGYRLPRLGTMPQLSLRQNLLTDQLDDLQLTIRQPLGEQHHVQLELLRSRPHFDGDSIFNIFATDPFTELAGRTSWGLLSRRLELSAMLGYRWYWHDEGAASRDEAQRAISAGLGARWRSGMLRASSDLFYLGGLDADTVGGDLWGRAALLRWLGLEGRVSLISSSERQSSRRLLNLGLQLGGTVRLWRGVGLHLLGEDNINRLQKIALRLLAILDLEFNP